jgi:dihydroorotate dehydrogenase
MIYEVAKRFLFRLDAEAAHDFTVAQIARLQQMPILLQLVASRCRPPQTMAKQLWGLTFRSPIGIAAGFDKNAVMIPFLGAIGFGFVEVGTVTLRPQPGNPRPRMFRYPEHRAVINRLGFNNAGADAVADRLQRWRASASADAPPLFVNVGKNKEVPLDRAADAYAQCYMRVARWADGAVLNLSSPNTPNLRDLQRPEHIESLLKLVRSVRDAMPFGRGQHPILIKIAPDLDTSQIAEICDVTTKLADGMICTNTTIERPFATNEAGGLSGKPLMQRATAVLAEVRKRVGPSYPLIGVGGVFDAADVRAKIAAGADLVQVYTGFVYEGPSLPARLARELA